MIKRSFTAFLLLFVSSVFSEIHWEWAKTVDNKNTSKVYSICEVNNTILVLGRFLDSVSIDGTKIKDTVNNRRMGKSVYIAKYDLSGVNKYARFFANFIDVSPQKIIADTLGHFYVTGTISDVALFYGKTITFDTIQLNIPSNRNKSYQFIAKYDISGNVVWVHTNAIVKEEHGYFHCSDWCIDRYGNTYIIGTFGGSEITIGGIRLEGDCAEDPTKWGYNTGTVFVAKNNAMGDLQWIKTFGGDTLDQGQCITVDNEGDIYAGGNFRRTAQFGSKTTTSYSKGDCFIMKLNGTNGDVQWLRKASSAGEDSPVKILYDRFNDRVFMFGSYMGTISFQEYSGSKSLTSKGLQDIFIVNYDADDGSLQWLKSAGGPIYDEVNDVIIDSTSFWLCGTFRYETSFDWKSITSSGGNDIYVAGYNSTTGDVITAGSAGGPKDDYCLEIIPKGLVMGIYRGSPSFGGITLPAAESTSIVRGGKSFIARYTFTFDPKVMVKNNTDSKTYQLKSSFSVSTTSRNVTPIIQIHSSFVPNTPLRATLYSLAGKEINVWNLGRRGIYHLTDPHFLTLRGTYILHIEAGTQHSTYKIIF